jgi:hypothetical protein
MDRIKDTNTHQNTKLKRITNEKKENRLSVCQGSNAATTRRKRRKTIPKKMISLTARGIATLVNLRL